MRGQPAPRPADMARGARYSGRGKRAGGPTIDIAPLPALSDAPAVPQPSAPALGVPAVPPAAPPAPGAPPTT